MLTVTCFQGGFHRFLVAARSYRVICDRSRFVGLLQILLVLLFCVAEPVLAQTTIATGGITQVSSLIQKVSNALLTASIAVCTCAIIWAGYKILFAHAHFHDVANVFIGAILIGSAGSIAALLLPSVAGS